MATVNDKIKKILAMIDGATTEGEARAASLALQRLLVGRSSKPMISMISLTGSKPIFNFSLCIRASSKMRVPFSYSQAWYYGTMVY